MGSFLVGLVYGDTFYFNLASVFKFNFLCDFQGIFMFDLFVLLFGGGA